MKCGGLKTVTRERQQCSFTKKVYIENTEYVYKCDSEQYCRRLCKAHYKLYTSKEYTQEPYKHSSKEKFYKDIKPLEIKGEE